MTTFELAINAIPTLNLRFIPQRKWTFNSINQCVRFHDLPPDRALESVSILSSNIKSPTIRRISLSISFDGWPFN